MDDVRGVVHTLLKSAVEMRESLCAAGKSHVFAEVVAAAGAIGAVVAHDASLDGDALSDDEVLDTWTHSSHYTGSLVTEDERCLECEVAVTTVQIIVHCHGVRLSR